MPKIPVYTRQESVTGSSGGALQYQGQVDTAGPAIARVGQTLAGIGINLAENNLRMQRQDEDNKIANLAVEFDRNLINDYIGYKQLSGDKAYGSQERLDAFQNMQLQTLTKDIDNRRVIDGISSYIQNRINSRRIDYAAYETHQREIVSDTTRALKLDSATEAAFNGVGSLEENLNTIREFIKTQHDNNEISTDTAEAWLLNAERKVAERTLAGIVNRAPESSIDIMKTGIFNQYLDSKTIEHYTGEARAEAKRQELINKAAISEQRKALEDSANKEISDSLLNGQLNKELLGKHRDNLSPEQYKSWVKEYDAQVENLQKTVDEEKAQTVESELFVKALTGDELSTQKGFEAFKQEISEKVARKELSPQKARQLLGDAKDLVDGDPGKKQGIKQSIDSIEVAYKNGILGEGIPGTIEREKMIRDLRTWTVANPKADPVEFTEKVLTAKKESWIKSLFRNLPGVSVFVPSTTESFTPAEMRQKVMETTKIQLPTKEELVPLIKESGVKTQTEAIKFIQGKYGISQEEAINYYRSLK
jgi:hypothetical protein